MRPALQQSWEFCEERYKGTEFAADEHVKVCISLDELKMLWEAGLCHLSTRDRWAHEHRLASPS